VEDYTKRTRVLGKILRRPQNFPPKINWRGGKIEAGGILYI